MNILLVTSLYPGCENQPKSQVPYAVHYLARKWVESGHNVKVINTKLAYPKFLTLIPSIKYKNGLSKEHSFKLEGVNITRVPIVKYPKFKFSKNSINNTFGMMYTELETENFKPDVVVCHMMSPSIFIGSKMKRAFDVPLILTTHMGDLEMLEKKVFRNEIEKVIEDVDAYGFRSNRIKELFELNYSKYINRKPHFIVRSGVPQNTMISEEEFNKKIQKRSKNIIIVSSMIKRKNIDKVIDAFANIREKYDVNLTIVGNGPEKNNLIHKVNDLNINDSVYFISEVDREKCMEILSENDIFAMISKNETLGLVYLEAMAKGCIIIGSKNEGIDGIIKDGLNGFLCNAGDSKELEKILEKCILMSEAQKDEILKESKVTINKFTEDYVSEQYMNFIREAIDNYNKEV